MKKISAFIAALTAAVCVFSACENKKSSSSSDTSPSETTAAVQTENDSSIDKHTASQDTTICSNENGEKVCREQINAYLDTINNNKIYDSLLFQYDENYLTAVSYLSGFAEGSDDPVESMLQSFEGAYEGLNLSLTEISSVEPLTEYQCSFIEEVNGRYKAVQDAIDKAGGVKNVKKEDLDKVYADDTLYKNYKMDFAEGYYTVCDLYSEGNATVQKKIMVYRTNDSGWKVDMTVDGYIDEFEEYERNHHAADIQKGGHAALKEIADFPKNDFIIASDKSLDKAIPDGFDADSFRESIVANCEDYEGQKFFIYFKDGDVFYTVCTKDDIKTGINPFGCIIAETDGKIDYARLERSHDDSFEGLYDMCAGLLK